MWIKAIIKIIVVLMAFNGISSAQGENPVAAKKAVYFNDQVRFTVLTPRLIRLEWSENNSFEDKATLSFVNRNLPVPEHQLEEKNGFIVISTEQMQVRYKLNSGKFNSANLSIKFLMDKKYKSWKPGTENKGNLLGTARTLDNYNGSVHHDDGKEIELSQGIISRDGWVLIDDSDRPVFDKSDWPWVQPRNTDAHQDWYFFGYGYDFRAALADFISVAGRIPIPPRFAFGYWWSRYWEYTDKELRELVGEFEIHDVPLDVLVVDMDWHITSDPAWYKNGRKIKDQAGESAGWTGFTWNKNYFPDPENFLNFTKDKGLKVCLNLHPASGIQPHEAMYPKMARAMGIDPATKKYVPFNITDKKFAQNFINIILRPMEKQGVDFWWLDWQQWSTTTIPGVNPTFYLNYVFFSDMRYHRKARPLIFHRYGGLGNNRYVIGFSGDAHITWKSLDYQPWFTATAANVGFAYWSHDIGGHMRGKGSPEMYTRWVQWGAFSPIFRTHATKSKNIERRIWAYPLPYYLAMRQAILQRYALLPYIYSAARKTFEEGIAICHPLYYDYPKEKEAYQFKNEYMFGDNMLIHPITQPMEKGQLAAGKETWLPEGDWYEWSTGKILKGGNTYRGKYALSETPVFVKSGAIIPMQPQMKNTHEKPVDPLILKIIPGESGETTLYDDAGNDEKYLDDEFSKTPITFNRDDRIMEVEIHSYEGGYEGMPKEKSYQLRFPLTLPPVSVTINSQEVGFNSEGQLNSWEYSGDELETIIHTDKFNVKTEVSIRVEFPETKISELSGIPGKINRIMLFIPFLAKNWWPLDKYSKDTVVRAGQLGLRLSQRPANARMELKAFTNDWKAVKKMVSEFAGENEKFKEYLQLFE